MNDTSSALLAEAKSLDNLISNLEVEAFRLSGAGVPHRALEAARKAKELRERRNVILQTLRTRQVLGQFDTMGASEDTGSRGGLVSQKDYEDANKAFHAADRVIFTQESKLAKIAKAVQGKAISAGPAIMPSDIDAAFREITRAALDMMQAAGTIEVYKTKFGPHRGRGERLQGQRSLERMERFWSKLPQKIAKAQAEAFQRGRGAFRTVILKNARVGTAPAAAPAAAVAPATAAASGPKVRRVRKYALVCRPGEPCFKMADRVTAIRRRQISPLKLRAMKRNISLLPGARLPDPVVLRLLANRIARQYPRPKEMREEIYGDMILEMTKRAAIYTANSQAGGVPAPKAVETAAAQVVKQDLPAIKEEVTTGVSAPAGEQVAAPVVAAAAAQVLQGAADAGAMPSVPAAPAAVQQQVAQVAAAPDPAAAASTMPDVEVVIESDIVEAEPAPEVAPAEASELTPSAADTEIAPAGEEPFYKKPLFWVAAAAIGGVGYMALRKKGEEVAGAVPAPAPDLAE